MRAWPLRLSRLHGSKLGFLGVAHSHGSDKLKLTRESAEWEFVGASEQDGKVRASLPDVKLHDPGGSLERAGVVAVEPTVAEHARDAKLALRQENIYTSKSRLRPRSPSATSSALTSRSSPPVHGNGGDGEKYVHCPGRVEVFDRSTTEPEARNLPPH